MELPSAYIVVHSMQHYIPAPKVTAEPIVVIIFLRTDLAMQIAWQRTIYVLHGSVSIKTTATRGHTHMHIRSWLAAAHKQAAS